MANECKDQNPNRWRAKIDEEYFFIEETLTVTFSYERHDFIDNRRWQIGNYFQTREDAKAVIDKITKIFRIQE